MSDAVFLIVLEASLDLEGYDEGDINLIRVSSRVCFD